MKTILVVAALVAATALAPAAPQARGPGSNGSCGAVCSPSGGQGQPGTCNGPCQGTCNGPCQGTCNGQGPGAGKGPGQGACNGQGPGAGNGPGQGTCNGLGQRARRGQGNGVRGRNGAGGANQNLAPGGTTVVIPPGVLVPYRNALQATLERELYARDYYTAASQALNGVPRFANIARAEQKHANAVANMILYLGGIPVLAHNYPVIVPTSVAEADATCEQIELLVITVYDRLIRTCPDPALLPMLNSIQAANYVHLDAVDG